MVSRLGDDSIEHAHFYDFPRFLEPGDLVVANTSATLNAALPAWREDAGGGRSDPILVHLSTPLPGGGPNRWVVELRRITNEGTAPLLTATAGERVQMPAGAGAVLIEAYRVNSEDERGAPVRLWVAELACPGGVVAYAARHGSPIRYKYVPQRWPLSYYQTVFATEPGSAEMPSAGRGFTGAIVERLKSKGVDVVPLVLHTGVGSLEAKESPYPERYRVPDGTTAMVNRARAAGGRVVAVGTTVVRALETVASADGVAHPGEGWTDLVISPERGLYAVDAMVTGLHEPRSSHLGMLEALAGRHHLDVAYQSAIEQGYLWHEFGDLHLILT